MTWVTGHAVGEEDLADAVEGDPCRGREDAFRAGGGGRRGGVRGGVPAVRDQPADTATSGWRAGVPKAWPGSSTGRGRRSTIRRRWRRSSLEACLDVRRAHPTWGPVKVRACARARSAPAGAPWPAASTIGALFDREGLTVKRKLPAAGAARRAALRRRGGQRRLDHRLQGLVPHRRRHPGRPADARRRLQPLPPALPGGGAARHRARLADPRRRLPRVRPAAAGCARDNGPPFATIGAGGLSRLSVRVIKAGVTPERIRPGKPQENGRHERLHLTLLQDTAAPPAATLRAQQSGSRVPGRLQRGAAARRPRQRHAGRAPRAIAAALGRRAALARARRRREVRRVKPQRR